MGRRRDRRRDGHFASARVCARASRNSPERAPRETDPFRPGGNSKIHRRWRCGRSPARARVSMHAKVLDESRVRKIMARVCERAGVAHRTPYDLRHTFATLLLSGQAPGLGGHPAPLTYVAAQLGHAKSTTTLTWYAHWIPSESSVR